MNEDQIDELADLISSQVYCVPIEGHSYLYEVEFTSCEDAARAVITWLESHGYDTDLIVVTAKKYNKNAYVPSKIFGFLGRRYKCPVCKMKFKDAEKRDWHLGRSH